eukprot:6604800-Heterocapsa_arctica.AAC.1
MGTDVLCQDKAGVGKIAVLLMAYLQQIDASERAVKIMGICNSHGLAYQIKHEFERFAKHFQDIETAIDASERAVKIMGICHSHGLAYQIKHEFERFAKYCHDVETAIVYGGTP